VLANIYKVMAHHDLQVLASCLAFEVFVEDIGFEPMTPCVQGRCSSQLS
jgi:hypothetical protein